ncbi:MAG: hypothetical protein QG639_530 [Patescibacteria group bacterium]|nr:hypothetical protein [Patescibacteria group bacterium]
MNTNATLTDMPNNPSPTPESTPAQAPLPTQPMTQQPPVQPGPEPVKQGVSEDTKTLITVLLLIFVFPVGLIVMFFWPNWKWWVKLLVALPVLFFGFLILSAVVLVAVNPSEAIEKAECVTACEESGGTNCVEMCSVPASDDTDSEVQYDATGMPVLPPQDFDQE